MLNKIFLIGRVGREPELRYGPSGKELCTFSVATTEYYKDKSGESKEKTEWHNIIAWGPTGKGCADHLSKGALVFIEGKNTTNNWEDKSGNKRQTTQVQVIHMRKLADGKGGAPKPQEPAPNAPVGGQGAEEDVPF